MPSCLHEQNGTLRQRDTGMTRETKIGLLVGLAFIIVIGILGLAFDFGFKAIYAWSFPYMAHRGRG